MANAANLEPNPPAQPIKRPYLTPKLIKLGSPRQIRGMEDQADSSRGVKISAW
jgi:hypothetical protein